jgi:hypothetical protein
VDGTFSDDSGTAVAARRLDREGSPAQGLTVTRIFLRRAYPAQEDLPPVRTTHGLLALLRPSSNPLRIDLVAHMRSTPRQRNKIQNRHVILLRMCCPHHLRAPRSTDGRQLNTNGRSDVILLQVSRPSHRTATRSRTVT